MTIKLDYSRDKLFTELGIQRLKEGYMMKTETSPQERFAYVAKAFASNDAHAQRMYDYSSKHWWSNSTPVLSFGRSRGLPISCYLPYLPDTREGLVYTSTECRHLSMSGGGVGLGIGIRASDSKSTGVMPHLRTYDADTLAYKQGTTRRGSIAAYLDISHPDIRMFMDMRKPHGGDINTKCLNLHHGINIPDSFMQIIEDRMKDPNANTDWPLIDPHSSKIIETVDATELWMSLIETRMMKGEPYIHFIDTSNRHLVPWLLNRGMRIRQSNLCTEILLPTDEFHTAVCCLGSFNLEYWDEWKDDELFISDCLEFLDNVLTYFIENADSHVYGRAIRSAGLSRDVGMGALGFHALLQSKNIPFESAMAVGLNKRISKHIREKADEANKNLAKSRGSAPYAYGYGVRCSHILAIAPNASSSIIMGNTSPSIEPFRANAYRQDTLSGSAITRNKYLAQKLDSLGKNDDRTWRSIVANQGSVQHLDFLDDYTKQVYKTALEIDQAWIIQHAADRQAFIDQGQSVNLFFRADESIKYISDIHLMAWKMGLKTLYYNRSTKAQETDNIGIKSERFKLNLNNDGEICVACE